MTVELVQSRQIERQEGLPKITKNGEKISQRGLNI